MRSRAAVLFLAVVALASCGGSGETRTVTVDGAGTPAAGPRTTTGPAADASGASGTTGAADTGPVLAERAGSVDGEAVRLELVELKRTNATTVVQLRLTTSSDSTVNVNSAFDDGINQKITEPDASTIGGLYDLDGIFLIDGKNAKKYLVGRDPQNRCVCDHLEGEGSVVAGAPLTLSATFGAPPPDVRTVDVFVPGFGTFKDVPLG